MRGSFPRSGSAPLEPTEFIDAELVGLPLLGGAALVRRLHRPRALITGRQERGQSREEEGANVHKAKMNRAAWTG